MTRDEIIEKRAVRKYKKELKKKIITALLVIILSGTYAIGFIYALVF